MAGNCTSFSSNTISTCIEGLFNPNDYLSFNLTDLRANSTTSLRAVDKQWTSDHGPPNVLLKDSSGAQVIRIDVIKNNNNKGNCTQLKVCAVHNNGPSITVPIGLILIQRVSYAVNCPTPKHATSGGDGGKGGGSEDGGGE